MSYTLYSSERIPVIDPAVYYKYNPKLPDRNNSEALSVEDTFPHQMIENSYATKPTDHYNRSNVAYYSTISDTNTEAMLLPQLLKRSLQLDTKSPPISNKMVLNGLDEEKRESSKSTSKGFRCMRYSCWNKSELQYQTCFCSEECRDNVFEHVHSAGMILVGATPTAPYTIVLRGRIEKKGEHEWEAPGGVRERRLSETAIGCAIRECVEETGMVVKVDKLEKYLLQCPMVAMPTKIGPTFTGKYHLAIFVHINQFNHISMHNAWSSRMNRHTQREVDKVGNLLVGSDSVDMEYSASLNLEHFWKISHDRVGKHIHPRKQCRILAEELPTELDPQRPISLCYRDYWCINKICERSLMDLIVSIPTLEDRHIWSRGFLF